MVCSRRPLEQVAEQGQEPSLLPPSPALLYPQRPWVPWVTREETWEGLNTQFLLPTTCLLAVLWGRQALLDQGLSPSTRGGGAASSSSFHKAQTRGGSNKAVHPFLVAL